MPTPVAAPTNEPDTDEGGRKSIYVSTSVNLERRVLRKSKAAVRDNHRQFRSVSAFINFHMAKALGLEL